MFAFSTTKHACATHARYGKRDIVDGLRFGGSADSFYLLSLVARGHGTLYSTTYYAYMWGLEDGNGQDGATDRP
jgi:hypothetical protein